MLRSSHTASAILCRRLSGTLVAIVGVAAIIVGNATGAPDALDGIIGVVVLPAAGVILSEKQPSKPMTASLFEADESPDQAKRLAPALRSLADRGLCFGTSSWKYEGWIGSIYTADRYLTRGKLSRKKFESECLREYAETFPTVGGDFSFYQFPKADFWTDLFARTPAVFTFGLKVPEDVTVLKWPGHARYGPRAGMPNEHFLDPDLFERAFLAPLEPHRHQVAVVMFEFGQFGKSELAARGERDKEGDVRRCDQRSSRRSDYRSGRGPRRVCGQEAQPPGKVEPKK